MYMHCIKAFTLILLWKHWQMLSSLLQTAFSDMVIQLAKMCVENSVVHYQGKRFKLLAVYTYWYGGPESGSIANIVVFSIVQNILLVNPSVQPLNMLQSTKRVLDDLFWLDWNSKTIQVCFEQGWNWVWDNLQRWCWEKCWFLGLHNYVAYSTGGHISTKMYVKNQQMLPDI